VSMDRRVGAAATLSESDRQDLAVHLVGTTANAQQTLRQVTQLVSQLRQPPISLRNYGPIAPDTFAATTALGTSSRPRFFTRQYWAVRERTSLTEPASILLPGSPSRE
jgi:hypothetical protein